MAEKINLGSSAEHPRVRTEVVRTQHPDGSQIHEVHEIHEPPFTTTIAERAIVYGIFEGQQLLAKQLGGIAHLLANPNAQYPERKAIADAMVKDVENFVERTKVVVGKFNDAHPDGPQPDAPEEPF